MEAKMTIPLARAPGTFFDQDRWAQFISYFDATPTALMRISFPRADLGFHRDGDPTLPQGSTARWRYVDELNRLGISLIGAFAAKLMNGKIISTGLPSGSDKRIVIPAAEWGFLEPRFVLDTAVSGTVSYKNVQVFDASQEMRKEEVSDKCERFLRECRARGQTNKKQLRHEAREAFGSELTDRLFNPIFAKVFHTSRGRQPKKS
jgi:hypothetical protein